MKTALFAIAVACIALPAIGRESELCRSLKSFVESVKPDETRTIEFHTSWGTGFKGSSKWAMFEKRCIHEEYPAAVNACDLLMEHGAVEFSSQNFSDVLSCLSPKTRISPEVRVEVAEVSFPRGTHDRGAHINLAFGWNEDIGGMSLKIQADGY
ncbi:MAG: hypothetical protein R3F22_00705 [Lysobacteraceae bacterium]